MSITPLIIALILTLSSHGNCEHPFLIVKKSEYARLRARAEKSPWKEMKSAAIRDAKSLSLVTFGAMNKQAFRLRDITSAVALAYILDPANRSAYIVRAKSALKHWDSIHKELVAHKNINTEWAFLSPVAAAYMHSVLLLDILHEDLSLEDRSYMDSKLKKIRDFHKLEEGRYSPGKPVSGVLGLNLPGILGTWALYKGDQAEIAVQKEWFHQLVMKQLTHDGLFAGGPNYGIARFGGGRDAKVHFMDILEYTGTDNRYYGNPKLANLYEWLYGHAVTPFGKMPVFGDTGPVKEPTCTRSAMANAARFSPRAAELAAYRNRGKAFPGRLFCYLQLKDRLPSPKPPISRIWPRTFAGFMESNQNSASLMGGLWNSTKNGSHTHKEMNAVYAAAYGEHMLVNAGYGGANNTVLGYPYWKLCNWAVNGNTVTIGYQDHQSKIGAGISEGFTSERFDYACGSSGTSLRFGTHQRSFCMIHPQDGTNGYFVIFDEVQTDRSDREIFMALHPNSDNMTPVATGKEYVSKIGPFSIAGRNAHLTLLLSAQPSKAIITNGIVADEKKGKSFKSKYLYLTYRPRPNAQRHFATVLFPHDNYHAKAKMTRFAGNGFTGIEVAQESARDLAVESHSGQSVERNGYRFSGKALLCRNRSGKTDFYFVRQGTFFDAGVNGPFGFQSSQPVSVHVKGDKGQIVSPGTEIIFRNPGITGVIASGVWLHLLNKGNGWVKAMVPAGTHPLVFANRTTKLQEPKRVVGDFESNARNVPNHGIYFTTFLPAAGPYSLSVFDALGRQVWDRLLRGHSGWNRVAWRPGPHNLASGSYVVVSRSSGIRNVQRIITGP